MKTRKKPVDRLSGERVRELLLMPGWKIIEKRLSDVRERKMRELVEPHDPIETANIRGAIWALTTAMQVPDIIVRESSQGVSNAIRKGSSED